MKKTNIYRASEKHRDCSKRRHGDFPSRSRSAWYAITILIAFVLSACGSNAAPTPIPTIVVESRNSNTVQPESPVSSGGTVVASAALIPAQEAHLAFVAGGNVAKVNARVGDRVTAGYILVELDNVLAQLEVERAKRALRELTSPAMIAAAEEALASAQNDLDDAQKKVAALSLPRASDALIDNAEAEITLAEQQLAIASDTYRQFARLSDGDPRKAKALVAMTNAQLNLNTLRAKYNWLTGKPSETDIAITQAKLSTAQAAVQEAEWYLDALMGEQVPPDASGMRLAQLQQARDDLTAAQERLDQTRLISPISGVVAQVNVIAGEYATPGRILVVVLDTNQLLVKTTDLSERDVTKVRTGAPASILIKALNREFDGEVLNISPLANTLGGDVVYEVTLAFDEQPVGALAGMSAEVTIGE